MKSNAKQTKIHDNVNSNNKYNTDNNSKKNNTEI